MDGIRDLIEKKPIFLYLMDQFAKLDFKNDRPVNEKVLP